MQWIPVHCGTICGSNHRVISLQLRAVQPDERSAPAGKVWQMSAVLSLGLLEPPTDTNAQENQAVWMVGVL